MTFLVAFIERVSETVAIIRVKNSTITTEIVNKDLTLLTSLRLSNQREIIRVHE